MVCLAVLDFDLPVLNILRTQPEAFFGPVS
jgi:hypothetical protein